MPPVVGDLDYAYVHDPVGRPLPERITKKIFPVGSSSLSFEKWGPRGEPSELQKRTPGIEFVFNGGRLTSFASKKAAAAAATSENRARRKSSRMMHAHVGSPHHIALPQGVDVALP
ncbi:hypothetical protein ACJRO7_018291 [Eucalyptus globulus]|uniref:Uncharacterized protein n=1 Tax=Eucalyptus globulus TaxID=34317 RepID=A0ABD3KUB9_EUCGL